MISIIHGHHTTQPNTTQHSAVHRGTTVYSHSGPSQGSQATVALPGLDRWVIMQSVTFGPHRLRTW